VAIPDSFSDPDITVQRSASASPIQIPQTCITGFSAGEPVQKQNPMHAHEHTPKQSDVYP